jgi:hypothetical protein
MNQSKRSRVSDNGRDVLRLLARASGGSLPLRTLKTALDRGDVSPAVQRASLSRTLRRLWRAGLVELSDERGEPLTSRIARIHQWAERVRSDPAGAYRVYVTRAARGDQFGSADAYARAYLEQAARVPEIREGSAARGIWAPAET